MALGRCAGCGKTDTSNKVMDRHVMSCLSFIALYKQDPARALDPRAELARYNAEENSAESREAAREERLVATFAKLDRQREAQAGRWAVPRDLLDDDPPT